MYVCVCVRVCVVCVRVCVYVCVYVCVVLTGAAVVRSVYCVHVTNMCECEWVNE